ncbi:uncharacterized protein EV154DRAFT_516864 [Mucor mucedo]|uniref:Large ribosomal subunit protein mL59 domain-containing protein n=1 Tax=Mucor saturninus TaxID=64648 RepID=A0A8H7QQM1_9FUNG|nr:uncharacterized protein EV154DRAFT_516864 [Mucor mucedo]KAG2196997.1 hypothetical protein INT47_006944 [Mucor saturninus]KAI7888645.1 hypothetical protein EV154DRAFT_516864 [Mucor mucedo]
MSTYRVFSPKFLSKLNTTKLVEGDIKAQLVHNAEKGKSFWRPAQVSKRVQNDLRKACLQQGVEPTSIGLAAPTPAKPLRYKPNKLEKHERMRAERQANIKRNLEKMPQTIQAWKEDKLKELAKQKSSMPF